MDSSEFVTRIDTALAASNVARMYRYGTSVFNRFAAMYQQSVTARTEATVLEWLATVVTASALVQWFTREPNTDQVVINLSETRTLGPLVAPVRRTCSYAVHVYRQSTLHTVLTVGWQWSGPLRTAVSNSHLGAFCLMLFAPPEAPPDEDCRR